jgi:hypothetical protein
MEGSVMGGGMTIKQEERRNGIGGGEKLADENDQQGSSRCGVVYVIADIQA